MTAIVLGLLLAAGVVVLVALPFLREPAPADDRLDAPTAADERRLALVEERDRALAALKELEFDHRTGKVDDDDYLALVGPLRRSAAAALRALDADRSYGAQMTEPETPDLPPEPAPPPDEGTPPAPPTVPEPYPPPDEATIPSIPQE
ncbi:MAG TPA: hypothetical protein VFA97_13045 [Gaiellaceae bacterium]|nr:hypothetical protein [Gaiellaceae bacterium]